MTGPGAGFTVSADMINGFGNRLSQRSEAVNTAASSLGAVEVTPDMFGPVAHEKGFTAAMAQSAQRITDLLSRSAEAIEYAAIGTKKTAAQYAETEEQNTAGFGQENFGLPGAMPPGVNPIDPGYGGGMGPSAPLGGGVDPVLGGGVGPSMVGGVDPMSAGGGVGPSMVGGMDPVLAGGVVGPSTSGGGPGVGVPTFTPPEVPPIGADLPGVTGASSTGSGPPGLTESSSMVPRTPTSGGTGPSFAPVPQMPPMPQPQSFTPPMPAMPATPSPSAPDKVRNVAPKQGTPPQSAWHAPKMPTTPDLGGPTSHKQGPVAHPNWTPPVPDPQVLITEQRPGPLEPAAVTEAAKADMPSLPPLPAGPHDLGTGGGSLSGGGPGLGSTPLPGAPSGFTGIAPPPGVAMSGAAPGGGGPAGMPGGHGGPGGGAGAPMGGMPMGGMGAGGGQGGDQVRKSAAYVKGEDIFKPPQENPPPPVIGGLPPKPSNPAPPAVN